MHISLLEATLGAAVMLAVPLTAFGVIEQPRRATLAAASTVAVPPVRIDYRQPGEFLLNGRPAVSPAAAIEVAGFTILRRQVSLADYGLCVAAGACSPAEAQTSAVDVPVTGVSWRDAEAYARWYSQATGESWRLPTSREVAAAAAERLGDDDVAADAELADDPANPAMRWIRLYRQEAAGKRPADPHPRPSGHYGANSLGVEDVAGNVWEWTSTCYQRVTLGADRTAIATVENCGVRVLEGRHRAYMSSFIRDGKSGGCAMGTPPQHLGFRLVRDEPATASVAALVGRVKSIVGKFVGEPI